MPHPLRDNPELFQRAIRLSTVVTATELCEALHKDGHPGFENWQRMKMGANFAKVVRRLCTEYIEACILPRNDPNRPLEPCGVCGRRDCDPYLAHNGVFNQATGEVRMDGNIEQKSERYEGEITRDAIFTHKKTGVDYIVQNKCKMKTGDASPSDAPKTGWVDGIVYYCPSDDPQPEIEGDRTVLGDLPTYVRDEEHFRTSFTPASAD